MTLGQSLKAGAIASAVAVIINAALFFGARAAGIISDEVHIEPGEALTVLPVIAASIVPTLVASMVCFLAVKAIPNGFAVFQIASVVLLLASLYGPFTIPNIPTPYALALCGMHVVVVACLLFFLKKSHQSA